MNTITSALTLGADNQAILPHDINEVYWGSIAFFLVVGLIWWKGGPAIKKAWNGRIDGIRSGLEDAEASRQAAEDRLAEVQARIADAGSERQRILDEAAATATGLADQIAERARQEAEELRVRTDADIEASRSQATADLEHEVAALTVGATEVVVRSSLDADTQRRLVEDYITKVGSTS